MKVLVDTSVWSLALRRRRSAQASTEDALAALVQDGRVVMVGPIRQELLSGIRDVAHFDRLRDHLRAFPDVVVAPEDYEEAAAYYNRCRAHGVQGSNTDFLICAIAVRNSFAIFTTDVDFQHFAKHLPLALYNEAN